MSTLQFNIKDYHYCSIFLSGNEPSGLKIRLGRLLEIRVRLFRQRFLKANIIYYQTLLKDDDNAAAAAAAAADDDGSGFMACGLRFMV